MSKKTLAIGLILAILFLCGGTSVIYRLFFLRLVHVPTAAMANTILPGDYVIIHKAFGSIKRGTIVAFRYPGDSAQYVSRVVGLPGEVIQIRGKIVYVDERPLSEERRLIKPPNQNTEVLEELSTEGTGPYRVYYVDRPEAETIETDFATAAPFRIPDDNYFMMGDNRDNSYDSRYRGPVPGNLIWGSAYNVYYSESGHSKEPRWERSFKRVQ